MVIFWDYIIPKGLWLCFLLSLIYLFGNWFNISLPILIYSFLFSYFLQSIFGLLLSAAFVLCKMREGDWTLVFILGVSMDLRIYKSPPLQHPTNKYMFFCLPFCCGEWLL